MAAAPTQAPSAAEYKKSDNPSCVCVALVFTLLVLVAVVVDSFVCNVCFTTAVAWCLPVCMCCQTGLLCVLTETIADFAAVLSCFLLCLVVCVPAQAVFVSWLSFYACASAAIASVAN